MKEFKPGDKVRRIIKKFGSLQIGDIVTVNKVLPSGRMIKLEEVSGTYDITRFELVEPEKLKSESILTTCL
jgi:hypothetical protein